MAGFDERDRTKALRYPGRPASLDVKGQQIELFPFDAFTYDRDERTIGLKAPWQLNLVNTDGTPYTGDEFISFFSTYVSVTADVLSDLWDAIALRPPVEDYDIIVEQGVIGDVLYKKYDSGVMVHTRSVTIPQTVTGSGFNWYTQWNVETYPIAFVGTLPSVSATFNGFVANYQNQTLTGFETRGYRVFDSSTNYLGYVATGYWK